MSGNTKYTCMYMQICIMCLCVCVCFMCLYFFISKRSLEKTLGTSKPVHSLCQTCILLSYGHAWVYVTPSTLFYLSFKA